MLSEATKRLGDGDTLAVMLLDVVNEAERDKVDEIDPLKLDVGV